VSTTSIEETVRTALNERGYSSYMNVAQPVIEKLAERERGITEQLLSLAGDLGADTDDVRGRLAELGLTLPAVSVLDDDDDDEEDDAPEPDGSDTSSKLDAIMARLDSLTAFARRNGYSGS
jgi:hypothetical protein